MAEILQFLRSDHSLDPEALAILGAAYDRVIAQNGHASKLKREIVAGLIIDAGMRGERDLEKLCEIAIRNG